MSNPIFDSMRGSVPAGRDFWNQFQIFSQTIRGNPQQMVQQLLSSGRMSQEQFQTFSRMADSILKK